MANYYAAYYPQMGMEPMAYHHYGQHVYTPEMPFVQPYPVYDYPHTYPPFYGYEPDAYYEYHPHAHYEHDVYHGEPHYGHYDHHTEHPHAADMGMHFQDDHKKPKKEEQKKEKKGTVTPQVYKSEHDIPGPTHSKKQSKGKKTAEKGLIAELQEKSEPVETEPPVKSLYDGHRTVYHHDEHFHGSSPTVVPRHHRHGFKEYKSYKKHGGHYLGLSDESEDMWKHHYLYGGPQGFEPPSPGMYGSRGPLFDESTGSP